MCGIIGVFRRDNSSEMVREGIEVLHNRGKDARGYFDGENFSIGHCLHSIVGRVKQPFVDDNVFVANCEIYNWKELAEKYGLKVRNDAELIFKLLETKGVSEKRSVN